MSYESKITSKGQITLPAELRQRLGLDQGDCVEFYFDESGLVCMRPRNVKASHVYEQFAGITMSRATEQDDDAIAEAVLAKDRRSRGKVTTKKGRR